MIFFIDFDDVILNTKLFSQSLKDFFVSFGVSEELFRKYYYDPADKSSIKLFDPEGLLARLEQNEKIDVGRLRENFAQHIKDLSAFVFGDVKKFLEFAGKKNVYLISFGLPDFQNKKIQASGVHELVSGCIVSKGSKSGAIKHVLQQMKVDENEKIIFIDDRSEQIQDIKNIFPEAVTFLICRKEGRYCDKKNQYCDYEINDLEQAKEIISKLQKI